MKKKITQEELKRKVDKFAEAMSLEFPDIKRCLYLGVGFIADNDNCLECGEMYPKYNEECRKFKEALDREL
ncbi:MAG: hypothetical protein KAQ85_11730 [Thermodesulfovibrionia bacterium]|nr:hypothetical protein [Thermodesulfovibrionia bacterium]